MLSDCGRGNLTECLSVGAGDAPLELPVSSLASLALDFEKDLNISDLSLFRVAGLLVGFFSAGLSSL